MTVAQGEITLNGSRYSTTQPVLRQPLDSFIPAQSTSGRKQRGDRILLDSSEIRGLTGGFGISRYRSAGDWDRFWDSTAETRFPGQITPSILEVDTTDDLTTIGATTTADYLGKTWTLSTYPTGNTIVNVHYFTGSTQRWTSAAVRTLGVANTQAVYDIWTDGILLFVLFVDGATAGPQIFTSNDGTTWVAKTMVGDDNAYQDSGLFWHEGSTLLVAEEDSSAKSIKVWKSTDNYANMTLVATITSSSGPKGWATFYDRTGTERPLLATAEGVYYVDVTNSTAVMLFPMATHPNNGLRMAVWESRLYIPIGGTGGAKMHRVTWTGSNWVVETIGPGKDDGLPSDRQADIQCLWPNEGGWLFAGTKATASVYPSVYAIDTNGAYHSMWKGATTNRDCYYVAVSALDDSTTRLHFTDAANMKLLKYPLDNPYANTSVSFTDGSYIDTPEDDGGLPELPKCWLEAVALSSHSSAAEDIDITYGLDGAARTTTSLGSITSTDSDVAFASGVGVSAKSLAYRIVLDRGSTATNKVSLKTFTTNYLVVPSIRYEYYVVIDPELTARSRGNSATADTIRTELETVESSVIMVGFKYDRNALVYIKCLPTGTQWTKGLERVGVANQWQELSSKGLVVLHLVELL